jgi:hypothetical protein
MQRSIFFNDIPIQKVAYEDTDYFRIYRDFLNDRTKYLQEIQKGCEGWDFGQNVQIRND